MNKKYSAAIDLQNRLGLLVSGERELLSKILDLINEAYENRSLLELGYASLFDRLVKHFKYSESAARRRIDAAILKRALPSLKHKIEKIGGKSGHETERGLPSANLLPVEKFWASCRIKQQAI